MEFLIRQSANTELAGIIEDVLLDVDLSAVSLALVFIAPFIDCDAICASLRGRFNFIGCTTFANYSRRFSASGFRDETVSVVYILNLGRITTGHLKDIRKPGGKYIAFSNGDTNIETLLSGIECIGGLAADGWSFNESKVFLDGDVFESGTVAADISSLLIESASACGWAPHAGSWVVTVTDSDSHEVKRLGSITAADYYEAAVKSSCLFGAYPVNVIGRNVLRAPLKVCNDSGAVRFTGSIGNGEQVMLTSTTRSRVLRTTAELIESRADDIGGAVFVFAMSCASRNQILADLSHKEYEMVREMNGASILVNLYGQFRPCENGALLDNQRIVLSFLK